jgi:addiction module HigA family antidote
MPRKPKAKPKAKPKQKEKIYTIGDTLQCFLDEYNISAITLSKETYLSYQTLMNILHDKQKISVSTAFRLGKFFGVSPIFWIELQLEKDFEQLAKNKKFISSMKKIKIHNWRQIIRS